MSEQNKAVSRRLVDEVFGKGNISAVDGLLADDFVDHNPIPDQPPGREGFKHTASAVRTAFPDLTLTVDDMIAEGDKVVTRWTGTGTHSADFMGIPTTGKKVTITGIGIDRIAGGKIVEHWEQFDAMGMMQQLGVIPSQ